METLFADRDWRRDRPLQLVCAAALLLTLFRAALFVFQPQLGFDSDQAVFGLMAKHLIELRAFPLFMYGQSYLLAVESWIAAPFFLLFGVSVPALKLPLLLINLVIAVLVIALLRRESGVDAWIALVASLFFVLAAPGTSETLLEASGCQVEPFLYALLLWMTRRRPIAFGVILAIGFLQREFTLYAAIAIVIIAAIGGAWRERDRWRDFWGGARVFAEVWLVIQVLRGFSPVYGPGTGLGSVRANSMGIATQNFCTDPTAISRGMLRLFTWHWPRLFGTERLPLAAFGLESTGFQGTSGSGPLLLVAVALCAARIVMAARHADRAWWARYQFCAYLVLVGLISAVAPPVIRCGDVSVMRYDLLSIFGAVGIVAWALSIEPRRWIRAAEVGLVIVWAVVSASAHARVWTEYARHKPIATKMRIVRALDARGIRYARADYWIAYYVTFVTNERIIVAAETSPRIAMYADEVARHRREAIDISRQPCEGGQVPGLDGVYFCPP